MTLEGTTTTPDIAEGKLVIRVQNTTAKEMARLYHILQTFFDQGVFNTRNGNLTLHFDERGELRGGDISVHKWKEGKPVITRVAMFDSATVEIIG